MRQALGAMLLVGSHAAPLVGNGKIDQALQQVDSAPGTVVKKGDALQFVHIPKTGGSSVVEMGNKVGVKWGDRRTNWPGQKDGEDTLAWCSGGCKGTKQPCSPWHLPPAFFEARNIHPNPYDDTDTFCVARHPFSRAVSQYVWNMQVTMRGASDTELNEACTATRMNAQILEGLARRNASLALASGGRTINSLAAEEDCHWIPLAAYTRGATGCKTVLNTETLAEDFDELVRMQARKHDPLAQLPKMVHNKSEHFCKLDVSELSAASRKALAEVYAEDIKLFGYSPDAPHMLPQKGAFKLNKARLDEAETQELKEEAKKVLQEARAKKEEEADEEEERANEARKHQKNLEEETKSERKAAKQKAEDRARAEAEDEVRRQAEEAAEKAKRKVDARDAKEAKQLSKKEAKKEARMEANAEKLEEAAEKDRQDAIDKVKDEAQKAAEDTDREAHEALNAKKLEKARMRAQRQAEGDDKLGPETPEESEPDAEELRAEAKELRAEAKAARREAKDEAFKANEEAKEADGKQDTTWGLSGGGWRSADKPDDPTIPEEEMNPEEIRQKLKEELKQEFEEKERLKQELKAAKEKKAEEEKDAAWAKAKADVDAEESGEGAGEADAKPAEGDAGEASKLKNQLKEEYLEKERLKQELKELKEAKEEAKLKEELKELKEQKEAEEQEKEKLMQELKDTQEGASPEDEEEEEQQQEQEAQIDAASDDVDPEEAKTDALRERLAGIHDDAATDDAAAPDEAAETPAEFEAGALTADQDAALADAVQQSEEETPPDEPATADEEAAPEEAAPEEAATDEEATESGPSDDSSVSETSSDEETTDTATEQESAAAPEPEVSPSPLPEGAGSCTSIAPGQTVSTEWCVNNCAMGNCPATMCSPECKKPTEAEIAWAKGQAKATKKAVKTTQNLHETANDMTAPEAVTANEEVAAEAGEEGMADYATEQTEREAHLANAAAAAAAATAEEEEASGMSWRQREVARLRENASPTLPGSRQSEQQAAGAASEQQAGEPPSVWPITAQQAAERLAAPPVAAAPVAARAQQSGDQQAPVAPYKQVLKRQQQQQAASSQASSQASGQQAAPVAPVAPAPVVLKSARPSLDALGRAAGTEKATHHSFTILYEPHFAPWRDQPVRMLEIGVKEGASLKMWDDYFTHPDAKVFGADIVKGRGIDEARLIQADQSSTNDLLKLSQKGPWNIVVDDGSHLPEHQLLTFRRLFPTVTPGGMYIIEGTETSYWKEGARLNTGATYNITGEVDVVQTFQRATNLIINREFRCESLKKQEPLFSEEIDATITSVTFIRNAVLVRKLPEEYIVHEQYRNHEQACYPEVSGEDNWSFTPAGQKQSDDS